MLPHKLLIAQRQQYRKALTCIYEANRPCVCFAPCAI